MPYKNIDWTSIFKVMGLEILTLAIIDLTNLNEFLKTISLIITMSYGFWKFWSDFQVYKQKQKSKNKKDE